MSDTLQAELKEVKRLIEADKPMTALEVAKRLLLRVNGMRGAALVHHRIAMAADKAGLKNTAEEEYELADKMFASLQARDAVGHAILRRDRARSWLRNCSWSLGREYTQAYLEHKESVESSYRWLESLDLRDKHKKFRRRVELEKIATRASLLIMQIQVDPHQMGPILVELEEEYWLIREVRGHTKAIYELDLLDELIRYDTSTWRTGLERCTRAAWLAMQVGNPKRAIAYSLMPSRGFVYGLGVRCMQRFD